MIKNIVLLSLLILFIFSCAGCGPESVSTEPGSAKSKAKKGADYIFFPPLPNQPRYQYLASFSSSKDVEKKKSKFFKFVAGDDVEKPKSIKKAYGVDIHNGIIYTCDMSNGVIITMDLKNHIFGYLGYKGSGKLVKPVNVKIDKENNLVFVADIGRKQVVCFNLQGEVVRAYGVKGQFHPSDVDIHQGKLFVCDVRGHQIHVLNMSTGNTLYKIGTAGSNEGQLFHPTNICIKHDRIYVSDTNNFRFQVFDMEGKFMTSFGSIGDRPGNFSRPKGIAVDKEKRIYIVDSAFENIQVFNKENKLLLFMLGPGPEKHNVNLPAGVIIDYDNLDLFKSYYAPKFEPQYLMLVTSNFGKNKVNVYAFGNYQQ
ncbi:MAG: 6-bladed beta-propeller [bacterium]|nr:6-bladed beta-propeller [bacterium]